MGKTREIKKRIKAVGNIKRITRTMQMIATSKFSKSQLRATATKPYTEGIFELVTELAATAGDLRHPLIDGPENGFADDAKDLVLVMTSDRGLCGPYNGNILRLGYQEAGKTAAVDVSGRKGVNFFKYLGIEIGTLHQVGDTPSFDEIARIAQEYMDQFTSGKIRSVRVVYMRYISAGRQTPEVLQLLPLKPPAVEQETTSTSGTNLLYEFSPPAEELLADLLPSTVKATLMQCFNDAIVSEHVARMIAMKAATDNAGKMGKALTRTFNRARQAQITTELTEIISGAAALE